MNLPTVNQSVQSLAQLLKDYFVVTGYAADIKGNSPAAIIYRTTQAVLDDCMTRTTAKQIGLETTIDESETEWNR